MYTLLNHEIEVESIDKEQLPWAVEMLLVLIRPENSPADDVLKMSVYTLNLMATRADRPKDPIMRDVLKKKDSEMSPNMNNKDK